jgi:GNAT superfamily N-acetyltransferase
MLATANPRGLPGITIHDLHEATPDQLMQLAGINIATFRGNDEQLSAAWAQIESLRIARPTHQYFVAVDEEGCVVGYAGWLSEGGFRRAIPVFQLEQVAVAPEFEGQGLALWLANESCERIARPEGEQNAGINFSDGGIGEIFTTMYARRNREEERPAIQECTAFFSDGEVGQRNIFGYPEVLLSRTVFVKRRVR